MTEKEREAYMALGSADGLITVAVLSGDIDRNSPALARYLAHMRAAGMGPLLDKVVDANPEGAKHD